MKVDAPTLARHMVEAATEFDYDELSPKVRRKLEDAAAALIAAMGNEPIVIHAPRPPKGGAGDSGAAGGGQAIVVNITSDPNRVPDAVLNRIVRERNTSRYFR